MLKPCGSVATRHDPSRPSRAPCDPGFGDPSQPTRSSDGYSRVPRRPAHRVGGTEQLSDRALGHSADSCADDGDDEHDGNDENGRSDLPTALSWNDLPPDNQATPIRHS